MKIALVGPLPPPSGGMANQTAQLACLLRSDGHDVCIVQTNPPYSWHAVSSVRGLRAVWRLTGFIRRLRRELRGVDIVHLMANSGWSWHLFSAPTIWIAHQLGIPIVVNYRGGEAGEFFAKSWQWIRPTIARATKLAVPSSFLQEVFHNYGFSTSIVPNIVDLDRFFPTDREYTDRSTSGPHLLVARNLEAIYDVGTAIRALKILSVTFPKAMLTVAGTGAEEARLKATVVELGLEASVRFVGRIENKDMPKLYQSADVMLNTSLVDNAPNAILEAWASGVPVVTTDVGGIRHLVTDGVTGCLVPACKPDCIADSVVRLLSDKASYDSLRVAGLSRVEDFTWESVRAKWYSVYDDTRKLRATSGISGPPSVESA